MQILHDLSNIWTALKTVGRMSTNTVDDILKEIAQLPSSERLRLKQLLEDPRKFSSALDRSIVPVLALDSTRELRWLVEHAPEYAGQWVAIDGDRLIAYGPNANEVFDAADADGAHLPLVTFVEDPATMYAGF